MKNLSFYRHPQNPLSVELSTDVSQEEYFKYVEKLSSGKKEWVDEIKRKHDPRMPRKDLVETTTEAPKIIVANQREPEEKKPESRETSAKTATAAPARTPDGFLSDS